MEEGMSFKSGSNGETTLERIGREARENHLKRNEWVKRHIEYTKALVQAEYDIQREFKVN